MMGTMRRSNAQGLRTRSNECTARPSRPTFKAGEIYVWPAQQPYVFIQGTHLERVRQRGHKQGDGEELGVQPVQPLRGGEHLRQAGSGGVGGGGRSAQ